MAGAIRLRRFVFWTALASALLATACGGQARSGGGNGGQTAGEPKRGGVMVLPNRLYPPTAGWDLMRGGDADLGLIGAALNGDGNLVKPCKEDVYKVCPGLAERWEVSENFTRWDFTIREGVKWHDGTPLTPEDIAWWLKLAYFGAKHGDTVRPPSAFKTDMGPIQSVELLDAKRVRVELSQSNPSWAAVMAQPGGSIQVSHPRHLMQPQIDAGNVTVTPEEIGRGSLGPFKLEKDEKGTLIQLRRFDGYWETDEQGRPLPYLDGIDYIIMTDPGARDAALRTGRVDGGCRYTGCYVSPQRKAAIDGTLGDKVWYGEIGNPPQTMGFNTLRPGPLQDVRVRRAISIGIDRAAVVDAVTGGFGDMHTIVSSRSPWPNPDWRTWPGFNPANKEKDRAEAKRLLAEAGYPNGFKMQLLCRPELQVHCEVVQGQLAPLGIEVAIDAKDGAAVNQQVMKAELDAALNAGSAYIPERAEFFVTRHSINPLAIAKHEDPRVPEMFAQLRAAQGDDQRAGAWRQIERYLILDQAYQVPLHQEYGHVPYRSYVKGMTVPLDGAPTFADFTTVWLDK